MADKYKISLEASNSASAEIQRLQNELVKLGGEAAVASQKEINKLNREIRLLNGEAKTGSPLWTRFTQGIAVGTIVANAVTKAFSFLKNEIASTIGAAVESEKVWNSVTASLKRHGDETGANTRLVQQFATGMQQLTGISDEMSGQAFQRLHDAGLGVQASLALMASAADLAAGTGEDLLSTVDKMTKFISGASNEIRGLKTEITAASSTQERMAELQRAIGERFAGAAQADLNTYAGKVRLLSENYDDLKEVVGGKLIPVLSSLAELTAEQFRQMSNADGLFGALKVFLTVSQEELQASIDKNKGMIAEQNNFRKLNTKEQEAYLHNLYEMAVKNSAAGLKVEADALFERLGTLRTINKAMLKEESDTSAKRLDIHQEAMADINKTLAEFKPPPLKIEMKAGATKTKTNWTADLEADLKRYAATDDEITEGLIQNAKNKADADKILKDQNAEILAQQEAQRDAYFALTDAMGGFVDLSNVFGADISPQLIQQMETIGNSVNAMINGVKTLNTAFSGTIQIGNTVKNVLGAMGSALKAVTGGIGEAIVASAKFVIQLGKEVAALILSTMKYIAHAAVLAAKAVASIPIVGPALAVAAGIAVAGGLTALIAGFDDPRNDAIARKWGRDAGNQYMQGLKSVTGAPQFGRSVVASQSGGAVAGGGMVQMIQLNFSGMADEEFVRRTVLPEVVRAADVNQTRVLARSRNPLGGPSASYRSGFNGIPGGGGAGGGGKGGQTDAEESFS